MQGWAAFCLDPHKSLPTAFSALGFVHRYQAINHHISVKLLKTQVGSTLPCVPNPAVAPLHSQNKIVQTPQPSIHCTSSSGFLQPFIHYLFNTYLSMCQALGSDHHCGCLTTNSGCLSQGSPSVMGSADRVLWNYIARAPNPVPGCP